MLPTICISRNDDCISMQHKWNINMLFRGNAVNMHLPRSESSDKPTQIFYPQEFCVLYSSSYRNMISYHSYNLQNRKVDWIKGCTHIIIIIFEGVLACTRKLQTLKTNNQHGILTVVKKSNIWSTCWLCGYENIYPKPQEKLCIV